jgi:hypothetical protein
MGKRSDYKRREMDFYATPNKVAQKLFPHLPPNTIYCEPCAGEGDLIGSLLEAGHHCIAAYDAVIGPWKKIDAVWLMEDDLCGAEMIITNPPWDRTVLHQIIERCASLRPTWLLFDADWMHTKQAKPHLEICHKIVAVGRVKWIADSPTVGKDNCCWYLFDAKRGKTGTDFVGL